jgi:uncharacterized protein (DUF362 family)
MNRREFLKKSVVLGFGAGITFIPGGLKKLCSVAEAAAYPDLVALKGGKPALMFDRGMKIIGGMGRFVKAGQTVVIKPNISWDVPPDGGANTSPELVASVIKHCRDAGASKVYVMDHSIEYWENSKKNSLIGAAIESAGGVYAPSESDSYYGKITVSGSVLKEALIHETLLEGDVLISVPVLKHHGGAGVSISAKGLMGCVWNRRAYHADGLQRCIADFLAVRKPDLNVIDAGLVVTRHGPRGGSASDLVRMDSLLISADVVASDSAGAMMLGHKPRDIEHIRLAAQAGHGEIDLSKLNIERVTV